MYFMKEKSEALSKFKEFNEMVEKEVDKKIYCLHIDIGGEYTSHEFSKYLQDCKIRQQLTCPNKPEQNGVVEKEE